MTRSAIFIALACVACGGSTSGGGVGDGGVTGGSGGGSFGGTGGLGGGTGLTGGTGGASMGGSTGCIPFVSAGGEHLGTYHLALTTTLGPTKPILYRAEVDTLLDVNGELRLNINAQPLAANDRVTVVGPNITLQSYPFSAPSKLYFPKQTVQVPGAANPITGSDIEADVELQGTICGKSEFFCGEMSGQITKPIALDLTGSHFALETVSSPELHVDCNMTVAAPLE